MTELTNRTSRIIVDGVRLGEGFRHTFRVEKTLAPKFNTAIIEIYNLGKRTRAALKRDEHSLQLFAGYNNLDGLIFTGNSYRTRHIRKLNGDIVTRIQCGDGEDKRKITINQPFSKGVRVVDVIRALVTSLQILPGNLEEQIALGIFSDSEVVTFQNGYAVTGKVIQALNIVLRAYDVRWSIQDNTFQVLKSNGVLLTAPILLTPATGLIGIPKETEKGGVIATALIQPGIKPGAPATITSREVNLTGRADVVRYIGDTHGRPWYVLIEARDLLFIDAFDKDAELL